MPAAPPQDDRLSRPGFVPEPPYTTPVGAAVIDSGLRFRSVNPALAEMNGMAATGHIGRRLDEVLPQPLAEQMSDVIQSVLAGGAPVLDLAVRGRTEAHPDQDREWLVSLHPMWTEGPRMTGVMATVRDLAAERRARAVLQERELLAQRVFENLLTYVGVLTTDGRVLDINRTPLQVTGVRREEVLGLEFWNCPWWRHDPVQQAMLRELGTRAARGETVRTDVTASVRGGRLIPLDFTLAPLLDDEGRITHLLNSATDISARKRSEEALRASAGMFRSVVESAPNGLVMVNEKGVITLLNSKMEDLFGYERGELLGSSIDLLVPPGTRERHVEHRTRYGQAPAAREMAGQSQLYARRKDGSEFPVEIGLMPVDTPEGRQTLAAVVDVSEHKQAQRALEAALREKTALLHEVHHRVKNNLQVISSLLSLQARTAAPEAREVLSDSQSRVKAMALTHQLLYEREDFSNVHMGLYLTRLVALLRQGHAAQRREIELGVDVGHEALMLDLQRALPCALLVTELVINAFKHAFPAHRSGHLTVRLRRAGEHDALIEVADDGIGIPPEVELGKTRSLGFQLLPLLADQLGAELTLHREAGSRFTIRFPLEAPLSWKEAGGLDAERVR